MSRPRGRYKNGEVTRAVIYDFIDEFIKDNGYSPSVREIGVACGLKSSSSVLNALRKLRERNLIDYKDHTSRTIRIV